eukprot:CAMPEP_0204906792 /NCGR_PEP_ID=MMETSP1397-20131031/6160_1 /ASSEMBLY_ACC=CAM_ASM_000891 /TAXON_ID=49980 /ORGANISM="Climacostomum Climacostomum virens, Strain Stock W-24" /LENGTH=173 /DNA_ID=CAMNT_0052075797 /DNA_START=84 /DNA_END=602 /DNA_ORIENTATION=+
MFLLDFGDDAVECYFLSEDVCHHASQDRVVIPGEVCRYPDISYVDCEEPVPYLHLKVAAGGVFNFANEVLVEFVAFVEFLKELFCICEGSAFRFSDVFDVESLPLVPDEEPFIDFANASAAFAKAPLPILGLDGVVPEYIGEHEVANRSCSKINGLEMPDRACNYFDKTHICI